MSFMICSAVRSAACSLLEHAYTILHVDDIKARTAILGNDWAAKRLPALREIAAENLRHDLDDAKQLQVQCSALLPAMLGLHGRA